MSLEEDSSKKRAAMCRKEYDILYNQLPGLLEKTDILFPAGKKMESSEPENKSETKKVVAPLPAVTPEEIGEGYKDLEESIKGFIKELDEAEKETEGTSEAATASERIGTSEARISCGSKEHHDGQIRKLLPSADDTPLVLTPPKKRRSKRGPPVVNGMPRRSSRLKEINRLKEEHAGESH